MEAGEHSAVCFTVLSKVVIPAKALPSAKFRFEKHLLLVIGHFLFSIATLNLVSNSQSQIANDQ
jgi:hypothetical protein